MVEKMKDAAPHERVDRVLDVGALRALAHPLRVRIYDILSQFGPQTASSLADRLGESSGATSYHLRALAKHDLIREIEGHGTGRERWWERPQGSITMTNPSTVKTPAGRAATEVVVGEFYRQREEQLRAYLHASLRADPETWKSLLTSTTANLTEAQFTELADSVRQLIDETVEKYRDQTGPGVRLFSIRTDIFPIDEADPS
ncbi:ArsR/SmtB family transcription factor [Microbacterium sp. NPDC055910]|uniref:ArsR/SmtB family transcription factor n=1 Tax=Microbacterium sp. NPDC055910 TaxID=3345659 RepID=UPI0035DA7B34